MFVDAACIGFKLVNDDPGPSTRENHGAREARAARCWQRALGEAGRARAAGQVVVGGGIGK